MRDMGSMKIVVIENDDFHLNFFETVFKRSRFDISIVALLTNAVLLKDVLRTTLEIDLIFFGRLEDIDIFSQLVLENNLTCPVIYSQGNEKADFHSNINMIGLLLKPLKEENILKEIKKYIKIREYFFNQFGSVLASYQKNTEGKRARFIVRKGQESSIVKTEDIAYFYNENRLTYIVDCKSNKFFLDEPLVKIQELLDPGTFFRVSRKYLININSIKRFRTVDKNKIQLVVDPEPSEAVLVSSS
ncbi:MAG TPA: LytTR family transcriptional regulator DNA-binding domain-containing protein, partial [Chitinophagaceae bacterium]